ncbi:MAG: diaminopimelate decarboxylase [Clostridiales bacterium]|nr:MAG: diaminopimelate decarboxylase [Clostridiales bacterium]
MGRYFEEKNGELYIDGVPSTTLAREYGTPLYVYSERTIRENCRAYKYAIEKNYNGNGLALYASKAFSCLAIYKIIAEEGLGADVVSGGELFTALKAGVCPKLIYFHGNNKTDDELRMAVETRVGHIVVDNIEELFRLDKIAKDAGKVMNISFRIKPGINAHTHEAIMTGQIDSKFGVALENGEAFEICKVASKLKNVNLVGVHCHIGSQIFDVEPFVAAAEVMVNFMVDLREKLGIEIKELNLGGGFGIRYLSSDSHKSYENFMSAVSLKIKEVCEKNNFPVPFVLVEPGRSIVGSAGVTLYTIGSVKNIKNVRTYVSVDGGMTDNPRYALYESEYNMDIATRLTDKKDEKVTVAGKCCESGDLLQKDIFLQAPKSGDILAVYCTGAYNYSMASNYNRVPRPAAVMVNEGESRIIIKREKYSDLIINDVL